MYVGKLPRPLYMKCLLILVAQEAVTSNNVSAPLMPPQSPLDAGRETRSHLKLVYTHALGIHIPRLEDPTTQGYPMTDLKGSCCGLVAGRNLGHSNMPSLVMTIMPSQIWLHQFPS